MVDTIVAPHKINVVSCSPLAFDPRQMTIPDEARFKFLQFQELRNRRCGGSGRPFLLVLDRELSVPVVGSLWRADIGHLRRRI